MSNKLQSLLKNCSGSYQMEYSFEVYNLSNNSGSPQSLQSAGIGQTGYSINSIYANTQQNGAATVSDNLRIFHLHLQHV